MAKPPKTVADPAPDAEVMPPAASTSLVPRSKRHVSGAGRPEYNPTPEQRKMVEAMVNANCTVAFMAVVCGVDRKTFRKAFRAERRVAKERTKVIVVNRLIEQTKKSTTAAIFYLCNADPEHWTNRHMMTHEGGSAARPIVLKMTPEASKY